MPPTNAEKGNLARFTKEEKTVLFALFQEYEEIIDIKHRKNSTPKKTCDVRRCWQIILDAYNNNDLVKTRRSLKQLQKFWLNSRLRKRYPSAVTINDESIATPSTPSPTQSKIPTPQLNLEPAPQRKIKAMATAKRNYKYDFQIITHQNDDDDESKTNIQQVSIDTISTENLSLNDLLEFKNSSHAEIIELKPLQMNQNQGNNTTLIRDQNDEDVEPILYQEGDDCEEEPESETTTTVIEAIPEPEPSFNHQHHDGKCCCIHRNNSDHDSVAAAIDDRLNMYRIKEAEFKYKEQHLRYVQQKMELTKTREELRHARELHRLQIQEMKTKLNILAEEEKKVMSGQ